MNARLQRWSIAAGAIALAAALAGAFLAREQFFRSWLTAYVYWLGLTLGGTAILMIGHLTGGRWTLPVRRVLEAGSRTMPLMALLFVPLLFGLRHLFPWARPGADELVLQKAPYLNVPFFLVRAAVYFAAWLAIAFLLNRWSARQDRTGDPSMARRMEALSGPGLVVYALTMTFAAVDWMMSLEPHWFSTIYGALILVGQVLTGLAFAIVAAAALSRAEPLSAVATRERFHDLGNLLFTFVLLWAYVSFAQLLITWSGNLPEEISWYAARGWSAWAGVAVVLILFHFAVPLFLLLSRRTKRSVAALTVLAGAMLAMRAVDVFWLVTPAFHPDHIRLHWLDFAAFVGIGGVWLAAFLRQLGRLPLLPLHDPCFKIEGNVKEPDRA